MGRRRFLFALPGLALLARCGQPVPVFTRGGVIQDFGRGTLAILHGREAVFTERQLRAFLAKALAR